MTTKKHTVAVGLNVANVDGTETRYEVGETITPKHIEPWMLEDGVVVVGDLPESDDSPESGPLFVDDDGTLATGDEGIAHDDQGGAWAATDEAAGV